MSAIVLLASLLFPPVDEVRIIFLGDSITRGVRAGVKENETFASLVRAALRNEKVTAVVTNRGIGGERTDQAIKRFGRDIVAAKPHVVCIMYGHNDSHVDRGQKKERITLEDYEKNLRHMVLLLRKAGIKPVLMTPPCYDRKARQGGLPDENPNVRLEKCAAACSKLAKELKVPLIDHWAHWRKQGERTEDVTGWTTDGYHANPKGHEVMTEVILPVLRKVLEEVR